MAVECKFGFEHETAFLRDGQFVDFGTTTVADFQKIIDELPRYESDYSVLRIGDAGIKVKRWYVEGYERFNEDGTLISFVPKGIEVRTLPQESIAAARAALERDFKLMLPVAARHGFSPAWIGHNPYKSELVLDPPLNEFERYRLIVKPKERSGYLTIYTFGPDMNVSCNLFSDAQLVDIAQKLTYYSAYLVPFSFSSPFYNGELWGGYSVRTYVRTGDRYAAKTFIADQSLLISDNPLVALARVPAEHGRIEFKAFDALPDFSLYESLMALIKGVVLDDTLPGRLDWPDKLLHQHTARVGFDDDQLFRKSWQVLNAAHAALAGDPDQALLERLKDMLERRSMPARALIADYQKTGSIIETLRGSYEKFTL